MKDDLLFIKLALVSFISDELIQLFTHSSIPRSFQLPLKYPFQISTFSFPPYIHLHVQIQPLTD